jgi:hypothetical protein
MCSRKSELAAGHGVLHYVGLITIMAEAADALDAHVSVLEQAAIQTKCETQLLSGQQAKVAIAAAFPLCHQV